MYKCFLCQVVLENVNSLSTVRFFVIKYFLYVRMIDDDAFDIFCKSVSISSFLFENWKKDVN